MIDKVDDLIGDNNIIHVHKTVEESLCTVSVLQSIDPCTSPNTHKIRELSVLSRLVKL